MKKTIKKSMRKKDEKKGFAAESGTLEKPRGGPTIQQDILRIGTILGKKKNYN